jgi:hypothetical protein
VARLGPARPPTRPRPLIVKEAFAPAPVPQRPSAFVSYRRWNACDMLAADAALARYEGSPSSSSAVLSRE